MPIQKDSEGESTWDAFISHASEDKDSFVRPLATALASFGVNIWYDEFTLELGDSLSQSIDKGLAKSRYGVVVLSKSFMSKSWPQRELSGLVAREVDCHSAVGGFSVTGQADTKCPPAYYAHFTHIASERAIGLIIHHWFPRLPVFQIVRPWNPLPDIFFKVSSALLQRRKVIPG